MSTTLPIPAIRARDLKLKRLTGTDVATMATAIQDWLDGTDTTGGKQKIVHGIVWGDVFNSSSTNVEVVIFYSE